MHGRNAAIATLLLGLTVAPVNAATYTYTGKNYTTATGNYTTSMSITGFFKVASPLTGNFSGSIVPQSYSFFDGVNTLDKSNSLAFSFNITTNSGGDIFMVFPGIVIATPNSEKQILLQAASDNAYDGSGGSFTLATSLTPGTWQRTDVSVVPVPAALPLLASGLGALGFIGWRRKRKAAAAA
jgi:hypothetical protein